MLWFMDPARVATRKKLQPGRNHLIFGLTLLVSENEGAETHFR